MQREAGRRSDGTHRLLDDDGDEDARRQAAAWTAQRREEARRGAIPVHMARPARRNRPRYAQAPQLGGHASDVGVDNGRPFVPPSLPSAFAALFRSTCGVSGS